MRVCAESKGKEKAKLVECRYASLSRGGEVHSAKVPKLERVMELENYILQNVMLCNQLEEHQEGTTIVFSENCMETKKD